MSYLTTHYPHLADRIYQTPLFIEPNKLQIIIQALEAKESKITNYKQLAEEIELKNNNFLGNFLYEDTEEPKAKDKSDYRYTQILPNGNAFMNISGTLVSKSGWMDSLSGLTSYDYISRDLQKLKQEKKLSSLNLLINSPGGESNLLFDLGDQLHDISKSYPTRAIVNDKATSAAYLLASPMQELLVSQTSSVGSIGVVIHLQNVKALEESKGIQNILLYKGERKIDGNPYTELTDAARANIESKLDYLYNMFVDTLVKYTGKDASLFKGTQANVYIGQDAVNKNLATKVIHVDQYISQLVHESKNTRVQVPRTGEDKMEKENVSESGKTVSNSNNNVVTVSAEELANLQTRLQELDKQNATLSTHLISLNSTIVKKELAELVNTKMSHLPINSDKLINLLSDFKADLSEDSYKLTVALLSKASGMLSKSTLLQEAGENNRIVNTRNTKSTSRFSGKNPEALFDAKVQELVSKGMKEVDAVAKVATDNVRLYEAMIVSQRNARFKSGGVREESFENEDIFENENDEDGLEDNSSRLGSANNPSLRQLQKEMKSTSVDDESFEDELLK